MSVITLLIVLAIVGLLAYVIDRSVPMPEWFRPIFRAVAAIVILLWLLQILGVWSFGRPVRL